MIIKRKSDITIANFEKHDELITYSACGRTTSCVKMRMIDGKRVYLSDYYCSDLVRFVHHKFTSLAALKLDTVVNHF